MFGKGAMVSVYLIVVASTGLAVLLRVIWGIYRTRSRLLTRLRERRRFQATSADGPLVNPNHVARERGQASIREHFTVTYRVAVPAVIVATLLLLGIPFIDTIPGAVLSVVIGAITVLAGVAARPFLENAIAGWVVSSSRMLNIGDTVEFDDIYGTIEDIGTTHTTIKVWDWRRYVIPNAKLLGSTLMNHSLYDGYIWASVEFWVSYGADLEAIRSAVVAMASRAPHFSPYDEPKCWIAETGPMAIKLMLVAWADSPADAWELRQHMRAGVVEELKRLGVHTHLHHHQFDPAAPSLTAFTAA